VGQCGIPIAQKSTLTQITGPKNTGTKNTGTKNTGLDGKQQEETVA
jgi:hypothetical protein